MDFGAALPNRSSLLPGSRFVVRLDCFVKERVDGLEERLDSVEVRKPIVLLGGWPGKGVGAGVEIMRGDGAGAKDDAGTIFGDTPADCESDDGIEDDLDGGAVGEAKDGFHQVVGRAATG